MKRTYLSLAVTLALAGTTPALAQTATGESASRADSATLEAVTVTARKREETLQDVPIAVTAFTPEAIDKLNIRDIGDLNAYVPNLTIYAARGSSSTVTAYIRGIGQSDPLWGVDPGVGIYLDDVYIARPQGALLDVFDVGRIEVLRGPQGTLYGKNTIGGAIKYVSRDLPTSTEGYAAITVGNHDQLDVKAALGGANESGVVRARVAVASLNRDGFGENLFRGQPVSDKEILAARMSLGIFPSEVFDLRLSADWMDDQSGARGARMLAPNRFAPTFAPLDSRYDVRSGMPNINDTTINGVSATAFWYPNSAWTFKSISAWRESDTETNIDFDTLPNPIADVKAFYSDDQFSQEFQANFDGGGPLRGVAGVYWFDGTAGGQVRNNFFGLLFGDTQGTVDTESVAIYADGTFDFSERLSVSAGLRWTDEKKTADVLNRGYSDGTYTTPISVAADFNDSVSFTNLSPKVSLDYRVTEDILLYGLYSRGFKSGGFNIRANAVAVPRSARPFDDEKVDSVEIGAKMSLLDDRAFLNLAYFHNKYEDIQLSVFTSFIGADGTPQFFGDFTNAGKGTVQGLEVEYQFKPSQRWLIGGNLAWLDATYDEFISAGVNVAQNQRFTNAPEWSGAFNVEHLVPLARGGELSARVGIYYQSEVVPTTDLSPAIIQSGYSLLNAGLMWRTGGPWTLSLQGTNLTDKEYRTTGYNIPALGILTGFYGPPRQIMLTARYDF
jgi:iron complex outermembrane recepter protein